MNLSGYILRRLRRFRATVPKEPLSEAANTPRLAAGKFITSTGEVLGKTAARHTSEQFVTFWGDVVDSQDANRESHVICDNVSNHKTALVQQFLHEHPDVHIHYTPTYLSWLNQVENWFARIQRDVIARGIFTSTKDLEKKLMRYIRQYNKQAKPIVWKYTDPRRRIASNFKVSMD